MTHQLCRIDEPFDTVSLPFAPIVKKRVIQRRSAVYIIAMRRSFFLLILNFCATRIKVFLCLHFRMWILVLFYWSQFVVEKGFFFWFLILSFLWTWFFFKAFILFSSEIYSVQHWEKTKRWIETRGDITMQSSDKQNQNQTKVILYVLLFFSSHLST